MLTAFHFYMSCVCRAAYSQSKPFIALFGFHLNLLPHTHTFEFCCNFSFLLSHDYFPSHSFKVWYWRVIHQQQPEQFFIPRLHHLQRNTEVHECVLLFCLNKLSTQLHVAVNWKEEDCGWPTVCAFVFFFLNVHAAKLKLWHDKETDWKKRMIDRGKEK